MTNSAPHDGQRPSLSEEKTCGMHETMEELPVIGERAFPSARSTTRSDTNRQETTQKRLKYAPHPGCRWFNNRETRDLYFVFNPLNRLVKIGIAHDVDDRVKQIEATSGMRMEALIVVRGAAAFEPFLHEALHETRGLGEWFRASASLDELVAGLKARPGNAGWDYLLEFIAYAEDRLRELGARS